MYRKIHKATTLKTCLPSPHRGCCSIGSRRDLSNHHKAERDKNCRGHLGALRNEGTCRLRLGVQPVRNPRIAFPYSYHFQAFFISCSLLASDGEILQGFLHSPVLVFPTAYLLINATRIPIRKTTRKKHPQPAFPLPPPPKSSNALHPSGSKSPSIFYLLSITAPNTAESL